MAENILVISGRMQSGKTNLTKHLYGVIMQQIGIVDQFGYTPDGDLLIPIRGTEEMGVFDIFRNDPEFVEYLYGTGILDRIDRFSFADQLKAAAANIFGIDPTLFSTDEGKNTETHITWKSMYDLLDTKTKKQVKEKGVLDRNMTVREVLQYFGTNVCRVLDNDCWVRATWNAVELSEAQLAVIDDCRFPNEFEYFKARGAKTIRLKRNPKDSDVISETAMDNIPDEEYDLVIDNTDMDMVTKNRIATDWLYDNGVLKVQV